MRGAVLVEGNSDRAAVEALAARSGRDLTVEGIEVVAIGGAHAIGRALAHYGPHGLDARLAGLCDIGEAGPVGRALERAGLGPASTTDEMAALGFFVCDVDLEDELIRALGTGTVEEILEVEGELVRFRKFQQQPAQLGRPLDRQLRRFLGTKSGRKVHFGRVLVEALPPERIPHPLAGVLDRI